MAIRRKKQKQQVIAKLQQIAPPGETFLASVHCETGPSPWFNALFDEVPLLGLIVALTRKFYFFTVTSQHVVLNSANRFTNRPGDVLGSWPRDAFPVTRIKRGRVWSSMYVEFAGAAKPTRINVHRYWRSELDTLLTAVGATADASTASERAS
jgi:hypothetical protein